ADPDPHRRTGRPGMARQRSLDLQRAQHCLLRAGERHEKRIPLGVHLMAALDGDRGADQSPVLGQNLRGALPQRLYQPRRTLDVREQERDRPTRKPAHAAASRAARTCPQEQQPGTLAPAPTPAPAPPDRSPTAQAAPRAGPSATPGTTTAPLTRQAFFQRRPRRRKRTGAAQLPRTPIPGEWPAG